jgi:hypothetical protein
MWIVQESKMKNMSGYMRKSAKWKEVQPDYKGSVVIDGFEFHISRVEK